MTLASNGLANAIPFRWTYADATARAAASGFTSADLYSVALQLDNATAWILTATTPTWVALAGTGMANPMTTAGDLILGGSSGTPGRLAKGSDSQVLTIDPATHLPVWAAAATGGAMELIHEEVFGSDAASYTFSAIPGTYRHLLLEVVGRCGQAAVSRDLCLRPNNDSGANYEREVNYNSSASAMASGLDTGLTQFFGVPLMGTTGAASYPGAGRFLIRDYARTNFYKAIEALWTYREASWVATGMSNGYWKSTAAITSLVCLMNGGSNILTGSVLSLYGIH